MGSRRFLITFSLAGGVLAGLAVAVALTLGGVPVGISGWILGVVCNVGTFALGGYLTWFKWARHRARQRGQILARLSQNDLTVRVSRQIDGAGDIQRLVLSLRRALSQVQRVTANVHRTCLAIDEQAR